MSNLHVGDIGSVIELTITDQDGNAVDISGATTKEIHLEKPGNVDVAKDGVFKTDGTDGVLKYTTIAGDLSATGLLKAQAYVVLPTGTWKSTVATFYVDANLV
jgi:hypothetical protein